MADPGNNPAAMDAFLEFHIGVDNANMRERLQDSGFNTLNGLVRPEPKTNGHSCATAVRKSTGGVAANKDVPVWVEALLICLGVYARYCYICQRVMDYAEADIDRIESLRYWYDNGKSNEKSADTLKPFTDGANKKTWFENLVDFIKVMIGASGMPCGYVIRENDDLPADDPGFAMPNFDDELMSRGRHGGYFWQADNRKVWLLIEGLTKGTTAWNTVKPFGRAYNGRGAFLALCNAFMGNDVKRLLLKRAELTLNHAVFDGKSKNWTFPTHISRLRESIMDMEDSGNRMTEQMKVNKLLNSFSYLPLAHLQATIEAHPVYSVNFDACVGFIQGQINALKLKNGPRGSNNARTLASIDVFDDTTEAPAADTSRKSEIKKAQRRIKQLQAKIKRGEKKLRAAKKNSARKFNKKNPGAYIPAAEWKKLTDEEKSAARKAREAQGIPTRRVGALTTSRSADQDEDMEDAIADGVANMGLECDQDEEDSEERGDSDGPAQLASLKQGPPQVPPSLLVAPKTKSVATTQRERFYLKKLDERARRREEVAWGVVQEEQQPGKKDRRELKAHR